MATSTQTRTEDMNANAIGRSVPFPGEWVTISEAVRLTGERQGIWCRRANREFSNALDVGRASHAIKAPIGGGSSRIIWWLYRGLDARLALDLDEQIRRDKASVFPFSKEKQKRAWRRCRWVVEWRRLCNEEPKGGRTRRQLAGLVVSAAKLIDGNCFKISIRSLQGWWRRYAAIGRGGGIVGVEGLI